MRLRKFGISLVEMLHDHNKSSPPSLLETPTMEMLSGFFLLSYVTIL